MFRKLCALYSTSAHPQGFVLSLYKTTLTNSRLNECGYEGPPTPILGLACRKERKAAFG